MACNLTKGRLEPCKDVVGGLKAVYFTDFGDLGTVTKVDDEITDLSTSVSSIWTSNRSQNLSKKTCF